MAGRYGMVGGVLVTLSLLACGGPGAADETPAPGWGLERPTEKAGPLGLRLEFPRLRWDDQPSEAAYRVSGTSVYWPRCGQRPWDDAEQIDFDDELPADAGEFSLPQPTDGTDFFLKELLVDVLALAPDRSQLAKDGIAATFEPPWAPDPPSPCP